MTEVSIAATPSATGDSRSQADANVTSKVRNVVDAVNSDYGAISSAADMGVAPISLSVSPVVVKGDSGQSADAAATQAGDTPTMTLLKLAIPIIGMIAAYYLTGKKEGIYDRPYF